MSRHPDNSEPRAVPDGAAHPGWDEIRELVLSTSGVTEEEATILLSVLKRLDEINREQGSQAAEAAARAVRAIWLGH